MRNDRCVFGWGALTQTVTTMNAQYVPCAVCQCPSVVVVYDYSEVEFEKMIQRHAAKPLCEIHKRPELMFFLDGHTEEIRDIKRKMWWDEWIHPPFRLADGGDQ